MTLIRYRDWYDDGGTRRQLHYLIDNGMVHTMRRGVFCGGTEALSPTQQYLLQVKAAAEYLGEGTVFSRYSAAALHGLPLLHKRLTDVTVGLPHGGHGAHRATLHARRIQLDSCDYVELHGLPTTGLARTCADLLRELPFAEAVILLDQALRLGVDPDDLARRTGTGRGCRMAARALQFADARSESPGESLSRVRMHQAGLPAPELQHIFVGGDGQFLGRSDFYWEHALLIGEFDGRIKYDTPDATASDVANVIMAEKERHRRLECAGYPVLRWTWPELWNGSMVNRLSRALASAAASAPVSVKSSALGWSK